MADVAAVGILVGDRFGRGDEIESMVAGFARHGILARFGHVAFDAAAAGAERVVVGVVGKHLVLWAWAFLGTVTAEAQGVGFRGFDVK